MQLSTLTSKLPQATIFKGGTTETEQAHYVEIGCKYSTVMENLKTGIIRILDDRAELSQLLS